MMHPFQLNFPIEKAPFSIEHGQQVLLIGSCFSDEMAQKFALSGHRVLSNPFGTVFHPIVIAHFLQSLFSEKELDDKLVQRDDLFFAWQANSALFAFNESDLRQQLNELRASWKAAICVAKVLVITLGTAFGYELKNGSLVANCHKFPANLFDKKLVNSAEIQVELEKALAEIKKKNPQIEIVLTLSPVRHSKDGLIENNRSKAQLIEAIHGIVAAKKACYFPAYEIVIDELRDYRFYKEDRVHPSAEAINYVWERFSDCYFTHETQLLNKEVQQYYEICQHKIRYVGSKSSLQLLAEIEKRRLKIIEKGIHLSDF